jgi:hypothetical protein
LVAEDRQEFLATQGAKYSSDIACVNRRITKACAHVMQESIRALGVLVFHYEAQPSIDLDAERDRDPFPICYVPRKNYDPMSFGFCVECDLRIVDSQRITDDAPRAKVQIHELEERYAEIAIAAAGDLVTLAFSLFWKGERKIAECRLPANAETIRNRTERASSEAQK